MFSGNALAVAATATRMSLPEPPLCSSRARSRLSFRLCGQRWNGGGPLAQCSTRQGTSAPRRFRYRPRCSKGFGDKTRKGTNRERGVEKQQSEDPAKVNTPDSDADGSVDDPDFETRLQSFKAATAQNQTQTAIVRESADSSSIIDERPGGDSKQAETVDLPFNINEDLARNFATFAFFATIVAAIIRVVPIFLNDDLAQQETVVVKFTLDKKRDQILNLYPLSEELKSTADEVVDLIVKGKPKQALDKAIALSSKLKDANVDQREKIAAQILVGWAYEGSSQFGDALSTYEEANRGLQSDQRDVRPILSKARLLRRLDKATESNIALVEAKVFERTSSVEMAEEIEDIVQDSRRKPSYLDNEADSGKQTDTKPVEELTQFPF